MPADAVIDTAFVGRNQIELLGYRCCDEPIRSFGIDMRHDAGDHIAAALNGAHDGGLASTSGAARPLVLVPVLILAPDIGFVDLNGGAQRRNLANDVRTPWEIASLHSQ